MKANLYIFELTKEIKQELEEETKKIEDDITEQKDMIEAYLEIYGEEDPDFEEPELSEDHKEQILDEQIKQVRTNIWDVETSVKVFKKINNKQRRRKAEDDLVDLNKRLEILESKK